MTMKPAEMASLGYRVHDAALDIARATLGIVEHSCDPKDTREQSYELHRTMAIRAALQALALLKPQQRHFDETPEGRDVRFRAKWEG